MNKETVVFRDIDKRLKVGGNLSKARLTTALLSPESDTQGSTDGSS